LLDLYSEPLFFKLVTVDEPSLGEDSARVLAHLRFVGHAGATNLAKQRVPLLLERRIGSGRTLMLTTSLRPQWNTLSKTNAVVTLDRIVRHLVRDTLPIQDLETNESITLPLPSGVQRSAISLFRPDQTTAETLARDARADEGADVSIANALERGVYRLNASDEQSGAIWNFPIAVNGPTVESHLKKASDDATARFAARRNVTLTTFGDSVSLRDMFQPRQGMAWWLVALVLGLLFVESIALTASTVLSFGHLSLWERSGSQARERAC
jgi:hypothetical protein